jgi:hypothetical protein
VVFGKLSFGFLSSKGEICQNCSKSRLSRFLRFFRSRRRMLPGFIWSCIGNDMAEWYCAMNRRDFIAGGISLASAFALSRSCAQSHDPTGIHELDVRQREIDEVLPRDFAAY